VTIDLEHRPALRAGEQFADDAFAERALPERQFGAHKWGVGGLLLIAGGPGYVGAAALAAQSAGRAGAGIVAIATPRGAVSAIAAHVPEAIYVPLAESDLASSSKRTREDLEQRLERCGAVVVGPGLGDDDYAANLLGTLFGTRSARQSIGLGFQRPPAEESNTSATKGDALLGGKTVSVVDADGLNWLAKQPSWWTTVHAGSLVLTPHVGEMARLTGQSTEDVLADPAGSARAAAAQWRQVVVLKYGFSIATDGESAIVCDDAPLSLATAGSGDVLAGAIGAFIAQGVAPLHAAGLALHIGSRAARRLETRFGVLGVVAGDLPIAMAEVIAGIERKRAERG
jgi:NAD(P)H-hydrate epimerase